MAHSSEDPILPRETNLLGNFPDFNRHAPLTPLFPAVSTVCSPCPTFAVPIENCTRQGCPFAWQRQGAENQARDKERDEREREERDEN